MHRILHTVTAGLQAVSTRAAALLTFRILAANRDEFLDRPTSEAAWHNFDDDSRDDNWVLCGRDLGSPDKGTWLGITTDLRIGILQV